MSQGQHEGPRIGAWREQGKGQLSLSLAFSGDSPELA